MNTSSPSLTEFYSRQFPIFDKVDNMRNILSNKLSILHRQEPKDIADIWFICRHLDFAWEEIIAEAGQKKVLEEIYVIECLRTFDPGRLEAVKWIEALNLESFKSEMESIIEDIISKNTNSLYRRYRKQQHSEGGI